MILMKATELKENEYNPYYQGYVEAAGGKILAPKMSIGEHGNMAFILDTEGNKIGLHSIQ